METSRLFPKTRVVCVVVMWTGGEDVPLLLVERVLLLTSWP